MDFISCQYLLDGYEIGSGSRQAKKRSYRSPVEATTIAIMTTKVATSCVAMLTHARIVKSTLKGFQIAVHKMDNAANGRSATGMFGPCSFKAAEAASSDNPSGLQVGSSLDGVSDYVRQLPEIAEGDHLLKDSRHRNSGKPRQFSREFILPSLSRRCLGGGRIVARLFKVVR